MERGLLVAEEVFVEAQAVAAAAVREVVRVGVELAVMVPTVVLQAADKEVVGREAAGILGGTRCRST